MEVDGFKFYNMPAEYNLNSYKKVESLIAKKYGKIKEIISIYNWGDVSNPGISDMDFIFVVDLKKIRPFPLLKRSFYLLSPSVRYIARHPFFYIDSEAFKKIKFVYPELKLKLLYGIDSKIDDISRKDKYHASISLLNDIIVRHYPRDFIEQMTSKNINVRDSLLRLNSIGHSIKSLKKITGKKEKAWDFFAKNVSDLRKNWFKSKNHSKLVGLCNDAIGISMHITEKSKEFIASRKIVKIENNENVEYIGFRNKSLFLKDWNRKEALALMLKSHENYNNFTSILPIELAAQLIEYSKIEGKISSYIKSRIKGHLSYDLKYSKVLMERIFVLNAQARLADRLKHSDFVAFFDYGYRSKSGINNILLNCIRGYKG